MSISIIWLKRLDSGSPVTDCVPVQLNERFIRFV